MSPSTEPFFRPTDVVGGDAGRVFFGGRCALALGALLLALFSLTTAARWLTPEAAFKVEKIVQQPVAPETSTFSSQTADVSAPDPGDAPP